MAASHQTQPGGKEVHCGKGLGGGGKTSRAGEVDGSVLCRTGGLGHGGEGKGAYFREALDEERFWEKEGRFTIGGVSCLGCGDGIVKATARRKSGVLSMHRGGFARATVCGRPCPPFRESYFFGNSQKQISSRSRNGSGGESSALVPST